MVDLANAFAGADTIAEIYKIKRELIKNGEDSNQVNRMASQRRRELTQGINAVSTLEKTIPSADVVSPLKVSSLPLKFERLETGRITVCSDGYIVV